MTLSEDLNFIEEQGGGFEDDSSNYPVVFGVTLTPKVGGILIGLLGLAGAAYMLMNLLMPTWETFQEKQTKKSELKTQIENKKASIDQIDEVKEELAKTKQQQIQVLSVFANEKTLDTLLIDLNRLVEAGNAQLSTNAINAKLQKFAPGENQLQPITDGSLGVEVDGKLKSSTTNIEIIGTYEQTQSIIRNIERLQPLLIVKEYKSVLESDPVDRDGKVKPRVGGAPIKTSFLLEALMPMNPEEIAAAAKAAEAEQ
ncbi:MAG: pilus assembly protein PilO [Mastigocoleus sp. MO_167.B18]|nr:pilus assembly protein PilO [Mastigocoleus sp. MO_167.B18]